MLDYQHTIKIFTIIYKKNTKSLKRHKGYHGNFVADNIQLTHLLNLSNDWRVSLWRRTASGHVCWDPEEVNVVITSHTTL